MGGMGTNLGGFSSAQLAAELEKRSNPAPTVSDLRTRSSVENFLGSAAELQARASVDALLANPFQSSGSSRTNLFSAASGSRNNLMDAAGPFGRGTSASNLLNAALQKNSHSDLLNAARNSFHKNSTSNLLNAARGSFHHKNSASNLLNAASLVRKTSASNLLNASAGSFKKQSTSNLLNALVSSGALRKGSTGNLLSAARAKGSSAGSAGLGLQSLLAAREGGVSANQRHSGASLSDLLERHNSMDFQSRVSNLMEGAKNGNWSSSGGGGSSARLGGGGSRSNLANLRMSMQNEGGGSSVFGNATFGGGGGRSNNKETRKLELAKLLSEQGMDAESAVIAAGRTLEKESLSAEMMEKEVMMQQLRNSSEYDTGPSPIGEYLMQQQMTGNSDPNGHHAMAASASVGNVDEAEMLHMLELKRKFLSQDNSETDSERAAKRQR